MASTLNETIRDDGLRLITKKLNYTKKVRVSVSALVGSAYDGACPGRFHFFEHTAFKGTISRPLEEMKKLFGKFTASNAYTAKLRTTYWAEAVRTKYDLLKDVVADIYLNPAFPEDEIQKEKEVVLNEAAISEENDGRKAWYVLAGLLWKENPLRSLGVGTAEGMRYINRDFLIGTHREWYASSNSVVTAVGNVDHNEFVKYIFNIFPVSKKKPIVQIWSDEYFEPLTIREIIIERDGREKAIVIYGCKVPKLSLKDEMTADILSTMLGSGPEQMLYDEIREKRGFAYSAGGRFVVERNLASYFYFSAGVLPPRLEDTKKLIPEIVSGYKLDHDHFIRTKEVLHDQTLVALEDPESWESLILHELIDAGRDIEFLQNYIPRLNKLIKQADYEEVVAFSDKFLIPERLACAVVKPS